MSIPYLQQRIRVDLIRCTQSQFRQGHECFLAAAMSDEQSWGGREKQRAHSKQHARNNLKSEGNPPGYRTIHCTENVGSNPPA